MNDETVNVRYMVDDVAAALEFYTTHFGFETLTVAGPREWAAGAPGGWGSPPPPWGSEPPPGAGPGCGGGAGGTRGRLWSAPAASPARPRPGGPRPGRGGWTRTLFVTADLDAEIAR